MVIHKCDRCGKEFKLKGDFKRHINRKYPCAKTEPTVAKNEPDKSEPGEQKDINLSRACANTEKVTKKVSHECNWCQGQFTLKSSLNRHLKSRCKVKKQHDNEKEQIYNKLVEDMNRLKDEVSSLKHENKSLQIITNNQTNNDISTNVNNNTTNLVAFGKEDFKAIPKKDLVTIMGSGYKSLSKFVKKVNFDRNRPENNNIYSNNARSKHLIAYNGKDWDLVDKKETMYDIVNRYGGHIEDKFYEFNEEDILDEPTKRKLNRFIKNYGSDEVFSMFDDDITLIMYNNKEIPKKRRDELEKMIENDKIEKQKLN